jgi:hypothetical protein
MLVFSSRSVLVCKIEEKIAADARVELVLFLGILVLMELATQRLSLAKLLTTGLLSLLGRGPVFKHFPRVFCIPQLCMLINPNCMGERDICMTEYFNIPCYLV